MGVASNKVQQRVKKPLHKQDLSQVAEEKLLRCSFSSQSYIDRTLGLAKILLVYDSFVNNIATELVTILTASLSCNTFRLGVPTMDLFRWHTSPAVSWTRLEPNTSICEDSVR